MLGLDLRNNLSLKVTWLKAQGVKDIGKALSTFPSLLTYSIEDKLDPQVAWLKRQGVTDIGHVLTIFPAILGYSIEGNLNPKVAWLKRQGVQDVGTMISQFPAVLSYNLEENLIPTFRTLVSKWGFTIAEIEASPMVLGASLKRLEALESWAEKAGVDLKGLPVAARRQAVSHAEIDSILRNLTGFLAGIRSRVPDAAARRKVLQEVVPSLQQAGHLPLVLKKYPGGILTKPAQVACWEVLEELINDPGL